MTTVHDVQTMANEGFSGVHTAAAGDEGLKRRGRTCVHHGVQDLKFDGPSEEIGTTSGGALATFDRDGDGHYRGVPLGPGCVTIVPMLKLRPALPFGVPRPMVDEWGSSPEGMTFCGVAEVEALRATAVPFVPPAPVRGVPGLLRGVVAPCPLGVAGRGGRD
jgi:hypothetical protein